MANISEQALLDVLELVTLRVGKELEKTLSDDIILGLEEVGEAFDKFADALEGRSETVADSMVDLAAKCIISVATMLPQSITVDKPSEIGKSEVSNAADLELIQKELKDRAAKSGIEIVQNIDHI